MLHPAAKSASPILTAAATWQENATNANIASDRIGALRTEAGVSVGTRVGLGPDDALHFAATAAGEWWPRFDRLSQASAGVRLEWRHKFGLGALAPVLAAGFDLDGIGARESQRNGFGRSGTLSLRKRFNDAWQITLAQEFARQDARAAVFDRSGSETAGEIEYTISDRTAFTLRAAYRDGDVLSYGTPPRPDLVALAPNRMPVTTFGRPMVAYSIAAHTVSARATLIQALDEKTSALVGWEWRETQRHALRYVNHLVSVSLVRQF